MKTLKFVLPLFIGAILMPHKTKAQTTRWMFVGIKHLDYKEYIASVIQNTAGLHYIAYCPTHQGIFIKYDTDAYSAPEEVLNQLINTNPKMSDLLIPKSFTNDSDVKELVNYCDFDKPDAITIKQELQK